jgi:hypothetical protein
MRSLPVPRGLFVLRYATSADGLDAPEIDISVEPAGPLVLMTQAGLADSVVLGAPGQAVPVCAREAGHLRLATRPQAGQGPREANVVLEPLLQSSREEALAQGALNAAPAPAKAIGVDVLAHVARRGDVLVTGGEWVCGPAFPMAIEGLELRLADAAAGLGIMTSATVNAGGRKRLPPAPLGAFVGTRGRAAPLVGVSFALAGPLAAGCRLLCEALFLGSAVVRRSGRSVELSGPTGFEPLVGLRLAIECGVDDGGVIALPTRPQAPAVAASPAEAQAQAQAPRGEAAGGRVRVFRAAAKARPIDDTSHDTLYRAGA